MPTVGRLREGRLREGRLREGRLREGRLREGRLPEGRLPEGRLPRPGSAQSGPRRSQYFWRRLVAVVAIAGGGAVASSTAQHLLAGASTGPSAPRLYVARPGDTIWAIAEKFSGTGDPRPLMDKLEAEIGGGVLQPGQVLEVP
jgi:hypothetical protein